MTLPYGKSKMACKQEQRGWFRNAEGTARVLKVVFEVSTGREILLM